MGYQLLRCLILLLSFGHLSGVNVNAAEPAVLHIATEHFPPYNFAENGAITGINTDLVLRSCELAALQCSVTLYPWLRAMEQVSTDSLGAIYSTARTAEREPLFQWVGPLAYSRAYLYRLTSRPDILVSSLDDAKHYSIGVARGDVYETYLQNNGFRYGESLIGFATKSDVVALFLKGKVDLLIGSEQIVPTWLAPYDQTIEIVEPVFELSRVGANYLALNREVPLAVVERLQQALDQLRNSGEYQQIVQKYTSSTNTP